MALSMVKNVLCVFLFGLDGDSLDTTLTFPPVFLSLPTTGAEVPFVFGLPAEVTTDAERSLSAAMGCYWTSFATTGSPNSGDCVSQLHLPQWPMLDDSGDVLQFQGTDVGAPVKIVKGLKNKACSTFAKHYNK